LGGGLSGTGVPFTFIKCNTDHPVKIIPRKTKGMEINRFDDDIIIFGKFNKLSILIAIMIKNIVNNPKIIAPIGVRIVRTFLVPVADLYSKSIHTAFKPIRVHPYIIKLEIYYSAEHILYSRFACANTAFIASYCGILIEQNRE